MPRSTSCHLRFDIQALSDNLLTSERVASERHNSVLTQLEKLTVAMCDQGSAHKLEPVSARNPLYNWTDEETELVPFEGMPIQSSCTVSCNCPCHNRTQFSFLNSLFIGYTGLITRKFSCPKASCKGHPVAFRGRLTYFFPKGFCARSLEISLQVPRMGEPTLSITLRNVLQSTSSPFQAISLDDSEALLRMLRERKVHPNSVEANFGSTLLYVRNKNTNVVSLWRRVQPDRSYTDGNKLWGHKLLRKSPPCWCRPYY